MKHTYFLVLFLCARLGVCAQKATLVFYAPKEEITIRVYKPIDGFPNNFYNPDELTVKPNMSINYELEVVDFCFILCKFSNGARREFLVFPKDNIEITCELQKITISGNNAEGHNYFNNNYVIPGALGSLDSRIMERYIKKGSVINYDSVYHYIQQEILSIEDDLKKMEMLKVKQKFNTPLQTDKVTKELSKEITSEFSAILSQNLCFSVINTLAMIYGGLIKNATGFRPPSWTVIDKEIKPSDKDVQTMKTQLSALLESPHIMSDDAAKMPYNFGSLYALKYNLLMDDESRKKLSESRDKEILGIYSQYLTASTSVQLKIWGQDLMSSLIFGFDLPENSEALLAYMDKKFPNSEYVAMIKELMNEKLLSKTNDEIIMLDDSISSLKELMQQPEINGKYAYVDLWATWCASCLVEFGYYKDVYKILAPYKNIVPIFISIDKEKDQQRWKNGVAKYNLNGYNVLASELLQKDIGMNVYNAKKVGRIPRYILLSPEGRVINDNMPKPSASTKMKPVFEKLLK